MRKMGAAGAAAASVSVAGCSSQLEGGGGGGGGGGDSGKPVQDDLPDERQMDTVVHVSNTERYYAARYQANRLVDKWFRDELGVPAETDPIEFTVVTSREDEGDFDMVTYNWCANNGDPDSIMVDRFAAEGSENHTHDGPLTERFEEIAYEQRRATDEEERQDLIYEGQNILGEQRPEVQYLYNMQTFAYNSDRFEEDSVVVDVSGLRNIWNYTQIQPKNEEGRTIITNNWDPTDQVNPLHINAVGPSRNWTPTRFMHDFLVRAGPELSPQPWAAEEWEWEDETTITFTLRDGMTFHDGEDVTAEDVAWTYQMIKDKEVPAYINTVSQTIDTIEQNDELSVTFNLQQAYVPFLPITAGTTPILPKHYWTSLMEETGSTEEPWSINIDNDRPIVGSGPFQWGNWDQGSRFEQPAFKEHFSSPNIDMRIQRPLSTRDAEMQAMINGDYDLLDFWLGDSQRLSDTVDENDHLTMVQTLDDCRQATWVNLERPPFDDIAMRQAMNAMVTEAQETIINEIYNGFGRKAQSPVNPSMAFWYNEDTTYFEGGVEGAIEILADAGYVWDSDDNIYYPEGKTGK
jgi:peptide/nickel transport system substrate-binding protein